MRLRPLTDHTLRLAFAVLLLAGIVAIVPIVPAMAGSVVDVIITPGAASKGTEAFSPNPVVVDVGDTVVWTNEDSTLHTATSGVPQDGPDGLFGGNADTGGIILLPKKNQSFTFEEAGEFPFFCYLHPSMQGMIVVEAEDAGLTVMTDRAVYNLGDTMTITGKVAEIQDGAVIIRVVMQDGTLVRLDQVEPDIDGTYEYQFQIGGPLFEAGKSYAVNAEYGNFTADTSFRIAGAESQSCQGLTPTILGTDGNDNLDGSKGPDVIVGLRGDDIIHGFGGNDVICGGPGDDRLSGGWDNDRVLGGRGNDFLFGNSGEDRMWGGTGFDRLFGNDGDDVMFGGKGRDNLKSGEGNDHIHGQEGEDILDGIDEKDGQVPIDRYRIRFEVDLEYEPGDEVEIEGEIEDPDPEEDSLIVTITGPDGDDETGEIDLDGEEFEFVYELDSSAIDGIYIIEVEYANESMFGYFLVNEEDDEVEVATDADTYVPGDDVEITGAVLDPMTGEEEVEITLLDPEGSEIGPGAVDIDINDEFEETVELDSDAPIGLYAIIVEYDNEEAGWAIFEVEEGGRIDGVITAIIHDSTLGPGDEVEITGIIDEDDLEAGSEVLLVVEDPDGDEVYDDSVEPETDNGEFNFAFDLEEDADTGTYTVTLSYEVLDDKEMTFTVSTSSGGGQRPDRRVELSNTNPDPGDDITISGHIDGAEEGDIIEITVTEPDGGDDDFDTEADDNEEFSENYEVPDPADDGIYIVEVAFGSEDPIFAYFLIDEDDDEVVVVTDEGTYEPGDDVEISGEVEDLVFGEEEVEIIVLDPEGNDIGPGDIDIESDGAFEEFIDLDSDSHPGTYAIIVEYDGDEAGWYVFEVSDDGGGSGGDGIIASIADTTLAPGDEVEITGGIDENDVEVGPEIFLFVEGPDGDELVQYEDSVDPMADGAFDFSFDLDDDAETGLYTVILSYEGLDDKELTFTVTTSSGGSGSGSGLTAKLSKRSLLAGESLTVSGVVPRILPDEDVVAITIKHPDGYFVAAKFPEPAADRSYSATFILPISQEIDEDYEIVIFYDEQELRRFFDITGMADPGLWLTVATNMSSYTHGSSVMITGSIAEAVFVPGDVVVLQVYNPNNEPYRFDPIAPDSNGTYWYEMVVGGPLGINGQWQVKVTYRGQVAETTFAITEPAEMHTLLE